jgi:DNA-binding transcriptional ArsR family regulator
MTVSTAEVFAALGDDKRQHILELLAVGGRATATELAHPLSVTRQAVTKHLEALEEAGLVASDARGRGARFRLTPRPMTEAMRWMADVGGEWDERLEALRTHLARRRP